MVFAAVDLTGVNDFTACKGFVQFQLTGPGVNLFTTLDDGDEDKDLFTRRSRRRRTPWSDLNQPSVARAVITTTATGSPGSPTGPSTTGSGTSTTAKGSTQSSLVGSAVVPFREACGDGQCCGSSSR